MSRKNYLEAYVEKAESKPNYDHHLAFGMKAEMDFFNDDKLSEQWANRLEYFEEIDVSQNALIEAVYYYGKWKMEKEYRFVERSLEKFLEMEMISLEKKWNWVLEECVTEQISLFFKLSKKTDLILIGSRIVDYLKTDRDTFPTHTIMKLTTQFIRLLEFMTKDKTDEIYNIILVFANDNGLNYSFREGFFDACVKIKKHYDNEASLDELHKAVLNLKIQEAETKGKHSKMLLSSLLEGALDYCIKYVNDKGITETLKKRIDQIDYTDELVPIELPEELKEKLNEAYRKQDELVRKSVNDYIEKIRKDTPIRILYGILNDESIFNMRIEETANFTKKLLKQSIHNIFTTSLDVGFKRKRLETESEKFEYKLHNNLYSFLIDNLNLIYYITSKIEDEKIVSLPEIYTFLSNCKIIDENDIQIIIWGIIRHCEGDYLSSVSILAPKIESSLYRYLDSIKADVSSYSLKTISQRSLGGLIELPEVAEQFSIDFQYFMKLLLVADDSINFRNRLSHGATSIFEFTRKVSLTIIFLLLKIFAKSFKISR